MTNKEKIMDKRIVNPTNEFHILRHFKYVSEDYKNSLVGKEFYYFDYENNIFEKSFIKAEQINHALNTIGTKFNKKTPGIETPQKLLQMIEFEILKKLEQGNINTNNFSFSIKYNTIVGKKNCLLYSDIVLKRNIKKVLRSNCEGEQNILINTTSSQELEPTNMIRIEVERIPDNTLFFITAYPDCEVPENVDLNKLVFAI